MASKKKSTDEFGNQIPERSSVKGGTVRSTKAEKSGSRSGSSLRARGIEKGNTAGRLSAKTMTTARSSGGESKRSSKVTVPPQSIRAAGAKSKASRAAGTAATKTVRASKKDSTMGSNRGASLRARGVEKGGVAKAKPSSYPQSARAAGYKAATTGGNSSFRSNRFGKGKKGGSAQVKPRVNQSMRAAEYKKKNPGKY